MDYYYFYIRNVNARKEKERKKTERKFLSLDTIETVSIVLRL